MAGRQQVGNSGNHVKRDHARVVIGTSAIVGVIWLLFASFILLAVGSAYLSPVYWISLGLYAGAVILNASAGGGRRSDPKWEYPLALGRRSTTALVVMLFVMLVGLVISLYLPISSSTRDGLLRGALSGLLLGMAAGITYMQFVFRSPRPRYCAKCGRSTWHLKVDSQYRCNVCGMANNLEG